MLHFQSITLKNFGPYKGEQIIDFTDRPGVNIIWGDNGRGKTTLLNAFRYALFGTIQRRNGKLRDLHDLENVEARRNGEYGFSITLKMNVDGEVFELTRAYRPRPEIPMPNHDEDYIKDVFLKHNGSFLSTTESEHLLNIIMPDQVSRFFLFDGELLQEYEELLENDTSTGERIKEAIEKILGVPVLTNGIVDVREVVSLSKTQKGKAAQKDQKTQQLALKLAAIDASIAEHSSEAERLDTELKVMIREQLSLQEQLEETDQVRSWISRRDALNMIITQHESAEAVISDQLQAEIKTTWRMMLAPSIKEIVSSVSGQISQLEQKKQQSLVAERFLDEIRKAVADHRCPVCEQPISDEYLELLSERISRSSNEFSGLSDVEKGQLLSMQAQLASLKSFRIVDRKAVIQSLESRRDETRIALGDAVQERSSIQKRIAEFGDTSGVASLAQRYAKLITKIQNMKEGIGRERASVQESEDARKNIDAQISKNASGSDLIIATRRLSLCEGIMDIFERGIEVYRDRLKKNVEKDATEIFTRLSSDKDYIGLQINDSYGLSIVHKDGLLVPGRSSGFEHIVALSLIGALHHNAPLQGPIIMDSPFGRLDPTHKRNIVRALPGMAEQAMLLAYTDEIDNQVARASLGGSLIREYRLVKVSSLHTRIE